MNYRFSSCLGIVSLLFILSHLSFQAQADVAFCASVTDISQSECEALAVFYEATGGNDWHTNTGWFSSAAACDWFGITCSSLQVSRLQFGSNNLVGTIPLEVYSLSRLSTLDLRNNQLSGTIASDIGNLVRLSTLKLNQNQLSGHIPTELGNLTRLRSLDLSFNQLSGSLPSELGNLTSIDKFNISQNQLTGYIPPELGNLTNVREFTLANNQLTGEIPAEFDNLDSVEFFYLNNNQLSGSIPPELSGMRRLDYFLLSNNNLTGSIPLAIANKNFVYLILSNNQLTGSIPSSISATVRLELDNNQFSGVIPAEFGSLEFLNILKLSNNRLSGAIPPELGHLIYLDELGLASNQLSGEIPSELGNITGLDALSLSANQLQGEVPAALTSFSDEVFRYNLLTSSSLPISDTETIAPTNLIADIDDGQYRLDWSLIDYTVDGGAYIIGYADNPNGPFTEHGRTADKTVSSYVVADASSNNDRYYVVQSYTPAHGVAGEPEYQQNNLSSSYSDAIAFDVAPVVTPPADITVTATGETTIVDLGTATAIDFLDGVIIPVADNTGPFTIGTNIVTWSAIDSAGNVGTATQIITVDSEWVVCSGESTICNVPVPAAVRYGANGQYTVSQQIADSIFCDSIVFGDPIFGVYKYCEYRLSSTADFDGDGVYDVYPVDASESADTDGDGLGDNADPAVNDTSNESGVNWVFCTYEWSSCHVSGDAWVRYGANGQYVYQRASGSIACSNLTFGDPIFGVYKYCEYVLIDNE